MQTATTADDCLSHVIILRVLSQRYFLFVKNLCHERLWRKLRCSSDNPLAAVLDTGARPSFTTQSELPDGCGTLRSAEPLPAIL